MATTRLPRFRRHQPAPPAQNGPAPTGIFSRVGGGRTAQNVWQDPLWIPASAELQHMALHVGTRKQILIIDSDALAVADCKAMVEAEGFVVDTAFDGEEGARKVLETNPDVVIVRLQLPKLNGIEVIRKIRTNDAHKRLPVIALAEADSSLSEADALDRRGDARVRSRHRDRGRFVPGVAHRAAQARLHAEEAALPAKGHGHHQAQHEHRAHSRRGRAAGAFHRAGAVRIPSAHHARARSPAESFRARLRSQVLR